MKKTEFFDRAPSCYFFDDMAAIADYCKEHWTLEVEHILRVADEACEHRFLFDLTWDMESTEVPEVFGEQIDWMRIPAGDPEFLWQFNRHRYFICLGQAYAFTGDEKYARAYVDMTLDWIDRVPLNDATADMPWRSLEVGLRGEYWNKALRYFMGSPCITEEFLEKYYGSMRVHAQRLIDVYSPFRYLSNWGIIESHGLFDIAMCLPQSEETRRWRDVAIERLWRNLRLSIMDDGMEWEQSPMYHNECLMCYFDVLILAKRNNVALPEGFEEKVKRMAYADLAWLKPNGNQPMMGDSDDSDVRGLLGRAALIFDDGLLRFKSYDVLDYDSIWELGIAAVEEYGKIAPKTPGFKSIALPNSGNVFLRSGWEEDANYLRLHSGTLGAGHGHSDKLHLDLVINGEDVLTDAGRYTYVAGTERYEFKDPEGHNTITVDGDKFTVCINSWEYSRMSQPVVPQFFTFDKYDFAQAGHLGYMDLPNGVYVNRKVVYIKPDIYVVIDQLYTGGRHSYRQHFHFSDTGSVALEKGEQGWCARFAGQKAQAQLCFVGGGEASLTKSRISRHYNTAVENDCVFVDKSAEGFTSMITVIRGGALGDEQELSAKVIPAGSVLKAEDYPADMAQAVSIKCGGREYCVICCHREVNSPTDLVEADGCMGYGCVIVFDKKEDCIGGNVLCW